MLGRPAVPRSPAVVVGPDDLVHERRPAENAVELDLAVVRLARVQVHEQRPVGLQQPARLLQAGAEEGRVVVERVVVRLRAELVRAVRAAPETSAVAGVVTHRMRSRLACVERRIDEDQVERRVVHRPQDGEIVAVEDLDHEMLRSSRRSAWSRSRTAYSATVS